MSCIRLLSTDFDGTLIGFHDSEKQCPASLAEALQEHRREGGLWAINTGRSLDHALEGCRSFQAPVEPDFLLLNERDVFRRRAAEWKPYGNWNEVCQDRHARLFEGTSSLFDFVEEMARDSGRITMIYEKDKPAGLVTDSEEVMEMVVDEITKEAARFPDFSFQRNTVYLRFCHRDYHKGSALGELCRLEQISPGEVFAIGDHFNDLSMLDGRYAKWTACPVNAIEPVKELVRQSGGYVATKPYAEGVAEALRFHRKNRSRQDSLCA